MTALTLQVQDDHLSQALKEFTRDGPWGVLFDGREDTFELSQIQGIEMGQLLDNEAIAGAVIDWGFHRLDDFYGVPMLIQIDELHAYLKHPAFRKAIVDSIKTARKKNWAVIGATQSIADVDSSELAKVLSEAFTNRIFLPNGRANEQIPHAMYTRYGLNEAQIDLIAGAIPQRDYYWTSSHGQRTFSLGLTPLEICIYGADPIQDRAFIESLGLSGDELAAAYVEAHGYGELAGGIRGTMAYVAPSEKEWPDRFVLSHAAV
jgi:type IV secretion system protein VirB4